MGFWHGVAIGAAFWIGFWADRFVSRRRRSKALKGRIEFRRASGRHRPPEESRPRLRSAVFRPTAHRRSAVEEEDQFD